MKSFHFKGGAPIRGLPMKSFHFKETHSSVKNIPPIPWRGLIGNFLLS